VQNTAPTEVVYHTSQRSLLCVLARLSQKIHRWLRLRHSTFKPRTVRSRRRPPRGSNRACVADVPPRRRTIFDSSELFARCGRSLLWLEQTSSPRGKNIRSPSAKTSSDLCSTLLLFRCIYSRVAAGTSPIPRHKKPESLKLAFSGLRHKPGAGWPESAIPWSAPLSARRVRLSR